MRPCLGSPMLLSTRFQLFSISKTVFMSQFRPKIIKYWAQNRVVARVWSVFSKSTWNFSTKPKPLDLGESQKWSSHHWRKEFLTIISQAWTIVTNAYQHLIGLKFGLISTHIQSFIEFGKKRTKLSSEKEIFLTKISQV